MTTTTASRTRSHSQLNDYLHCSWSFRLKRILRIEESPSCWLPGGIAFHAATEGFDVALWEDEATVRAEGDGPWREEFVRSFERQIEVLTEKQPDVSKWRTAGRKTADKPNGEDLDWWHTAGQDMVTGYVNWRLTTSDTWVVATVKGAPGVEVEVRSEFGGVPVVGYVDRLFRVDGQLVLADLKTGSRIPQPTQLAQYSLQLEKVAGEPITWGVYYDARKQRPTDLIDLSRFTDGKFGVIYDALDRAAEAGIFLPRMDSHCNNCGVRSACVFQGGVEPEQD